LARIIALPFALHLDDICAKIGQQLSAPRTSQNARQLQNAD
jgi:hypothetical protein